jgi:DNA-binding response OmpR family regulator
MGGMMKILAIDDDQFILDILRLMLSDHHEITTVTSATKGFDVLKEFPDSIDLILLDWMMPEIDGLSFLLMLRSNQTYRRIPVVFVSGKDEYDDIQKALLAGASDYITKPFKRDDLKNRVEAINLPG